MDTSYISIIIGACVSVIIKVIIKNGMVIIMKWFMNKDYQLELQYQEINNNSLLINGFSLADVL